MIGLAPALPVAWWEPLFIYGFTLGVVVLGVLAIATIKHIADGEDQ